MASVRPRDVVFGFFSVPWAIAVERDFVMPEDRLADTLTRHPAVRRLLVANPYRSLVGRVADLAGRRRQASPFPGSDTRALYEPLRLSRTDPVAPARAMARYEAGVRRAARRAGLERPAVITAHPLFAGFGNFDWAGPVTYYAWDNWSASEPFRAYWPAYEEAYRRMRENGRRACAISQHALDVIAPTGPSAVIPNGLEPAEWTSLGEPPAWFAARSRPRLLYIGSVDSRLDVVQLRAIAEAYPEGSVTLLGAVRDAEHFEPLSDLSNLEFVPAVPRAEVTRIIGAADACLIPHVGNELTEAMSPLKLYEYLAGGRPVAAVDLGPIAAVEHPRLVLGPVGGDLRPAVAKALQVGPASEADRLAFVDENAWSGRFDRLLELALAE
jgi:glycosyltransferase involved in cell wall biosynthesis